MRVSFIDRILGIVQAIEKLQKKCVVKFTETEMHIICASDVNEGGIQVWSCVDLLRVTGVTTLIVSQSGQSSLALRGLPHTVQCEQPDHPHTLVRSSPYHPSFRMLTIQRLLHDLQRGSGHEVCGRMQPSPKLTWSANRLAKKNDQAVLSFDISGSSRNGRPIRVVQDVRIEVMKPQDVDRLAEPMCPEPDVRCYFIS